MCIVLINDSVDYSLPEFFLAIEVWCLGQCRIDHMAEAAYATGPALLGAPRFSLLFFSEFFVFCFSAGPKQCARVGPQRV